jgi:hypothetical protein
MKNITVTIEFNVEEADMESKVVQDIIKGIENKELEQNLNAEIKDLKTNIIIK